MPISRRGMTPAVITPLAVALGSTEMKRAKGRLMSWCNLAERDENYSRFFDWMVFAVETPLSFGHATVTSGKAYETPALIVASRPMSARRVPYTPNLGPTVRILEKGKVQTGVATSG